MLLCLMLLLGFAVSPHSGGLSLALGKSLAMEGKPLEAVEALHQAEGSDDPAVRQMASFWFDYIRWKNLESPKAAEDMAWESYLKYNRQKQAVSRLNRLISRDPLNPAYHQALGELYTKLNVVVVSAPVAGDFSGKGVLLEDMPGVEDDRKPLPQQAMEDNPKYDFSTPRAVPIQGFPYAAMHEAELLDALSQTAEQKIAAYRIRIQALRTLSRSFYTQAWKEFQKGREFQKEHSMEDPGLPNMSKGNAYFISYQSQLKASREYKEHARLLSSQLEAFLKTQPASSKSERKPLSQTPFSLSSPLSGDESESGENESLPSGGKKE